MKEFKIGDKVSSYIYGHGTVINIINKNTSENAVIIVKFFDEFETIREYTQDGKFNWQDNNPDLFHGHVEFEVTVKEIPQYEYKFLYTEISNNEVYLTSHHYVSEDEFHTITEGTLKFVRLVEESKRERKST